MNPPQVLPNRFHCFVYCIYHQNKEFTFLCDKKRTRKIYPLNKILSVRYSVIHYQHRVVQQTSITFCSCIADTLYPLNSSPLFSLPQPLATTILYSLLLWV